MDLVTAEDWCGMLVGGGGGGIVCLCVVLCACLECLPPHPVNQKTHTGGEGGGKVAKMRRKCRGRNDCRFIHLLTGTAIMLPGLAFRRSAFLKICHLAKQSVNFLVQPVSNLIRLFDLSGWIKPIEPVH